MQGNAVWRETVWRPWAGARAREQRGLAALLFIMQISLVFWPASIRAARRLERERQKQVLLNELAAEHAPPVAEKQLQEHAWLEMV